MSAAADLVMRPFRHGLRGVQVVSPEDREQLARMISRREPFLAKGLVRSWPLVEELGKCGSVDEKAAVFENLFGDTLIRYTHTPAAQQGDIGLAADLGANFKMDDRVEPAGTFLRELTRLVREPTGECIYGAALPLSGMPQIAAELHSLDDIADRRQRQRNLWIGSGDHVVDLHFDYMRNLLSMVAGVKRVTILPPESLPYIYPSPLHRPVAGVTRSLVKLLDADLASYPRFEKALEMAQVALVEPGDTLYIPPLWWHHVESYGFNAMVNAWYDDTPQASIDNYRKATRRFFKSLLPFKRISDDDLVKVAAYMEAVTFVRESGQPESAAKLPIALRSRLSRIRRSLEPLDDYWRDYLELQYRYYGLRAFGDPYPTLPGMLDEVAEVYRSKPLRGIQRRLVRLFRR